MGDGYRSMAPFPVYGLVPVHSFSCLCPQLVGGFLWQGSSAFLLLRAGVLFYSSIRADRLEQPAVSAETGKAQRPRATRPGCYLANPPGKGGDGVGSTGIILPSLRLEREGIP